MVALADIPSTAPSMVALPMSLVARQQVTRALAQQCMEHLIRDYGATRVMLCGSTADVSPWHEQSDLDLAVEGLATETLERAADELTTFLPAWLTLDLIPLERVHTQVRQRLLEGAMSEASQFYILKRRLQDEVSALQRVQQGLALALVRVSDQPVDEFVARALATYVEDFYTGCERICERVAVTLDGGLPQGANWHRTLLGQMADPGGAQRPALFSGDLLLILDEFRRFRHRVRHLYGYELDPARVFALAQQVEAIVERIQVAVERFNQWLEQQDKDD